MWQTGGRPQHFESQVNKGHQSDSDDDQISEEDDQESAEEQNFHSQIHNDNQMDREFAKQTNYNQSSSHNTFLAGNSASQNKISAHEQSESFLNQQQQQDFNLNLVQMQPPQQNAYAGRQSMDSVNSPSRMLQSSHHGSNNNNESR